MLLEKTVCDFIIALRSKARPDITNMLKFGYSKIIATVDITKDTTRNQHLAVTHPSVLTQIYCSHFDHSVLLCTWINFGTHF